MTALRVLVVTFVTTAAVALLVPAPASSGAADDPEARSRVACLRGSVELRLRIDDDSSGSGSGSDSSGSGSSDSKSGDFPTRLSTGSDDDPGGDTIEVELRVYVPTSAGGWRIVLLHERHLVYQGSWRARPGGYRYRLSRSVPNWPGSEWFTARLTAPSGRVCRVSATI